MVILVKFGLARSQTQTSCTQDVREEVVSVHSVELGPLAYCLNGCLGSQLVVASEEVIPAEFALGVVLEDGCSEYGSSSVHLISERSSVAVPYVTGVGIVVDSERGMQLEGRSEVEGHVHVVGETAVNCIVVIVFAPSFEGVAGEEIGIAQGHSNRRLAEIGRAGD